MKVTVIVPVGPGHEALSKRAALSVSKAWASGAGPFTSCGVALVPDLAGTLGRSEARNRGLDSNPADWHFLLDADDTMDLWAFERVVLGSPATFGAIYLNGHRYRHDTYPVTRDTLLVRGARGTLSMGCFVRGDLGLRFNPSLDLGEDFDFYMRLPGFVKLLEPLVHIDYRGLSAAGSRGRASSRGAAGWLAAANAAIDHHRHRVHA